MNRRMICLVLMFLLVAVSAGAQENMAQWTVAAQAAISNAKITDPNEAMAAFGRGNGKGEFIVNLRPEISPLRAEEPLHAEEQKSRRRAAVSAARERVLARMPAFPASAIRHRYDNILAFSVEVTPEELQLLSANPDVQSIEPVFIVYPKLAQGIPLMRADTYRSQYNGQGLSIAVVDSGIDYNNPYLGGGGFPNSKVIGGYDVGQNDGNPLDGYGHGTACAGIAAGALAASGDYIGGVAYNAKLYALKVTTTSTGSSASTSTMVAAWDWCVTHQNDNPNYPIMIITTSYGSGRSTSFCDSSVSAMTDAARAAKAAGITLFASAGNDGYCDALIWPACISHVVSVGAVYDAAFGSYSACISTDSCSPNKVFGGGCDSGAYAADSTAADRVASYSNSASFLALYSPANRAYTLGKGGSTFNSSFGGTSAAAPYAAGAAAALQSAAKARTGSWLTPDQVKLYLTRSGDNITDAKSGLTKPRVNLREAIIDLPVVDAGKSKSLVINTLLLSGDEAVAPSIPNGNFELGRTSWTEYSEHGYEVITTTFPGGITPHSGSYAVWLGGVYDDTKYIRQSVTVSAGFPYLTYYHYIASVDSCGWDYGYVRINGENRDTLSLCASNNTGAWAARSVNLAGYAGQTVSLEFRSDTDGSQNSNWFIDDVAFRSSALMEAGSSQIMGGGAGSAASRQIKSQVTP